MSVEKKVAPNRSQEAVKVSTLVESNKHERSKKVISRVPMAANHRRGTSRQTEESQAWEELNK